MLRPLFVLVALALAACSARSPVPLGAPPPAGPPAPGTHVLAGELALARGDALAARDAYLAAARNSDDSALLLRAVEIVAATGGGAELRPIVDRWLARAPDSVAALRWHVTLALRARELDFAARDLARLYSLTDAVAVSALFAGERPTVRSLAVAVPLADAHPDDAALAYGVALLAERGADLGLAARLAARALALKPDWDEASVLAARVALRRGGGRPALGALERLAAAEPDSALLAVQTATLLSEAGAAPEARRVLDRYLADLPGDLDVRYARALLLAQGLDRETAMRELLALRDLGVRADEVPYWMGLLAEQDGDDIVALDWYRRVGDAGPLAGATLRAAAIVQRREGLELARTLIAQVRAARPDLGAELFDGEAELLFEASERAAARDLIETALELEPDNETLIYRRAELAARAGDLGTAERELRALLERRPDDPELLNALGYTLADANAKLAEARALIDAALAAAPDSPAIIDSAGWVRFRLGDRTQARALLERAWTLERDAEIGAHFGEVLWSLGEREAARRVWAVARERDATHAVLNATIERLER